MGKDYTYSELMAMQEEATQRVREMQRRAQITTQRAQEELDQNKTAQPTAPIAPPESERMPPIIRPEEAGDRFAFLDSEPQRTPPAARRPHQQKHISLPVDFIQEKHEGGREPREKGPLGLLEGSSDQSLLLALMLLLNGEGTDELLLLALLYMMM